MAFKLGESNGKLPPIRKRSVKGTNSRDSDNNTASSHPYLHRKQHGLVRLPPIERTHLTSPQSFETRSCPGDNDGSLGEAEQYKSEEAGELISLAVRPSRFSPTVKDGSNMGNDEERGFPRNDEHIQKAMDVSKREPTPSRSPLRRSSVSTVQKHLLSRTKRHFQEPASDEKPKFLYRKRALAKSSPELAGSYKDTLSPTKTTGNTERRASVIDMSAALLSNSAADNNDAGRQTPLSTKQSKQRIPKIEGTARRRTEIRKKQLAAVTKTHSNPASPLFNEPSPTSKTQGRKSLSDIQGFGLPVDNRRPSLEPVKTQNLMTNDQTGLAVQGKTCPRSERRPSRSLSSQHLAPPSNVSTCRKDSLYDLGQILGILNQEQATAARASPAAPDGTPPPGNSAAGNMAATSVYDLREFLSLALSEEFLKDAKESPKKSSEMLSQTYAPARTEEGGSGSNQSPSLDGDPATRRASAYNLMEFLTLGLSSKRSDQSSIRSSYPPTAGLQAGQQENGPPNLEVPGYSADSSRRGSMYDLVEFLSLRASPRPHSPHQPEQNTPSLVVETAQELDQESPKERSLSVYDLKEFLAMQQSAGTQHVASQASGKTTATHLSTINLTVPGKETPRNETSNETAMKSSSTTPTTVIVEGEAIEGQRHENRQFSVYDLREFLKLYSLSRKPSSISQSAVTIYVTDEPEADSQDDNSLPVPPQKGSTEVGQRKASTYDLAEFLNVLEKDNSPLRRRMSSISGASGDYSEHHRPSISSRSDSGGSGSFLCVTGPSSTRSSFSETPRSRLMPRQDSMGNRSLYDLHEFLTLINSEDVFPGRRVSVSVSERGKLVSPSSPSRQDEKFVFDLEERKDVNSDTARTESKRHTEKDAVSDMLPNEDISIEVPTFVTKATEKSLPDRFSIKNRLALKSVPEATDN